MRHRLRAAFTVIEISVAAFILVLVFLMGFTFFSGSQRGLASLTEDLDVNATIESAFNQISRDIRASSEVESPGLIDPTAAPPKFEIGKTSLCVLKQTTLECRSTPVTVLTSVVRYYLDKPEEVGDLDSGEKAVFYSLFKKVNDKPVPPDASPLLSGIQELTFYRTKQSPTPAGGVNGTGFYVLHVNMKVSAIRKSGGRKVFRGYAAELETMVRLRGSL